MSSYTEELKLSPFQAYRWITVEEFEYYTDLFGERKYIKVPKNFITDLASVPRFLWNIFPPFGKYTKAAVLHDYLYQNHSGFTRKEVDKIFKEAMKVSGVNFFIRNLFYLGVRVFGKKAWEKN
jgi:hypothetical protein